MIASYQVQITVILRISFSSLVLAATCNSDMHFTCENCSQCCMSSLWLLKKDLLCIMTLLKCMSRICLDSSKKKKICRAWYLQKCFSRLCGKKNAFQNHQSFHLYPVSSKLEHGGCLSREIIDTSMTPIKEGMGRSPRIVHKFYIQLKSSFPHVCPFQSRWW